MESKAKKTEQSEKDEIFVVDQKNRQKLASQIGLKKQIKENANVSNKAVNNDLVGVIGK